MSSQSPLTAITGVGDATAAALDSRGITNVKELADAFDDESDAIDLIPANYRAEAREETYSLRQAAEGNGDVGDEASVAGVPESRPEFLFTGETADKAANQSFVFGDYDADGTVNVDDIDPLNAAADESFYGEVSFASEIDAYQTISKNHRKVYSALLDEMDEDFVGRVKQPVSVIRKLREKYFALLKDVIGTTIYGDDHTEILDIANDLKENYRVIDEDDYIRNPKGGTYFAYHLNIVYDATHLDLDDLMYPFSGSDVEPDENPLDTPRTIEIDGDEVHLDAGEVSIEIQLKTKEEWEDVHMPQHHAYKNNEPLEPFAPIAAKYARKYAAEGVTDWKAPLREYNIDPDAVDWFDKSDVDESPDHPETTHEDEDDHPLEDSSDYEEPESDANDNKTESSKGYGGYGQ